MWLQAEPFYAFSMQASGQSESDTLSNWATGAQPYYISTETEENQGVQDILFVVFVCGRMANGRVFAASSHFATDVAQDKYAAP